MSIEFYNVKKREKVKIEEKSVTKTKYERKLANGGVQTRYAFRATDDDGTNLTKFCKEADWTKSAAKEA